MHFSINYKHFDLIKKESSSKMLDFFSSSSVHCKLSIQVSKKSALRITENQAVIRMSQTRWIEGVM